MTKWTTSNPDLQKILEKEDLCYPLEGLLAQNLSTENPKVLGVSWDTKTDSFLFNPAEIIKAAREIGDEPSKRNILQISSRIVDPMGFLAPTVLSLKMIFQRLWQDDAGWDKPVPKGVKKIWEKTITGLHRLEELRIPRLYVDVAMGWNRAHRQANGTARLRRHGALFLLRYRPARIPRRLRLHRALLPQTSGALTTSQLRAQGRCGSTILVNPA